jgi:hypothetical protein
MAAAARMCEIKQCEQFLPHLFFQRVGRRTDELLAID